MNTTKNDAWQAFEKSGEILEYLKFKACEHNEMNFEAGEELEFNKNCGFNNKNNKIR